VLRYLSYLSVPLVLLNLTYPIYVLPDCLTGLSYLPLLLVLLVPYIPVRASHALARYIDVRPCKT
jgi:hypothetical protein